MQAERSLARPPSWMRHGAVGVMVIESLLALLALPVLPIVVAIALTFSVPNWSSASPTVALALGIVVGVTWLVGPVLSTVALLRGFGTRRFGRTVLTVATALTCMLHVGVGSVAAVLSVRGGLVVGDVVFSILVVALGVALGWIFVDARRHPREGLATPVMPPAPPRPDASSV